MLRTTVGLVTLLVLFTGAAFAQPMSLMVSPIFLNHTVPLTQALAELGTRVQGGYVSFGIDLRIPEPEVELKIADSVSLGSALAQVVGQVRGYGYQAISEHAVEVYSIKESLDPRDVLNLRVAEFVVTAEPATNVFSKPTRFILELKDFLLKGKTVQACGSIGPGLSSAGPGISLNLREMTLRRILDAVAEADAALQGHSARHTLPVGWVHRARTDEQGKLTDTWSFFSTVPRDWDHYAPPECQSDNELGPGFINSIASYSIPVESLRYE